MRERERIIILKIYHRVPSDCRPCNTTATKAAFHRLPSKINKNSCSYQQVPYYKTQKALITSEMNKKVNVDATKRYSSSYQKVPYA